MLTRLFHRLLGHSIKHQRNHLVTMGFIESGWDYHYLVCSCGARWRQVLVNPLHGDWRWIREA